MNSVIDSGDPVQWMLDRYIYITVGKVFRDVYTGEEHILTDFNEKWKHIFTGTRGDPLAGNMLLAEPRLRRVYGRVWLPMPYGHIQPIVEHNASLMANTWDGFPAAPEDGDCSPWLELLEHLFPDPDERSVVLRRLAFDIQHPDLKCNWHLVIIGIQGAGKDSLLMPIARIFGDAYSVVGNEDISSSYDNGFTRKKIVHVSEVRGLSGSSLEKVKRRAASEGSQWTLLNPKMEPQVNHPNIWSFVFLTNHRDAIRVAKDERRFFVTYSQDVMPEDLQRRYFAWLEAGGHKALFRYLLDVDLTDFSMSLVPFKTPAFWRMCDDAKSDLYEELQELADTGQEGFGQGVVDAKSVHDLMRQRRVRSKISDVKQFLEDRGWVRIEQQPMVKIGGFVRTLPRSLYVEPNSPAVGVESKAELYRLLKELMCEDSLLD